MCPSTLMFLPLPVITALVLFLSQRTRFLMVLLAAESVLLTIVGFTVLNHSATTLNNTLLMFLFLALGACEAALGLALLVAMSRSFGSDLLTTLSVNKC